MDLLSVVKSYSGLFATVAEEQQLDSTSLSILYLEEDSQVPFLLQMEILHGREVATSLMQFCGVYPRILEELLKKRNYSGKTDVLASIIIRYTICEIFEAVVFDRVPLHVIQLKPAEEICNELMCVLSYSSVRNEWYYKQDNKGYVKLVRSFLHSLDTEATQSMFLSRKYNDVGGDERVASGFLRDINRWHKLYKLLNKSDERPTFDELREYWYMIILLP
jgi:hypothetical protein